MAKNEDIPIAPREHKKALRPADKRQAEDQWVSQRSDGAMRRFTIDLPEELHRATKAYCAHRGMKMNALIRDLLERTVRGDKST